MNTGMPSSDSTRPDDARFTVASTLSRTLAAELTLLEELLYRLTLEHLVVASGSVPLLDRANREVDDVVERLRVHSIQRDAQLAEAAAVYGVDGPVTLTAVVDAVDEPWTTVLRRRGVELRETSEKVQVVTRQVREAVNAGAYAVQSTLDTLHGGVASYDASGARVRTDGGALLLDGVA